MNKAQKKRRDQDLHALRIHRAALLAFIASENQRWNNKMVRETLEVVDNVNRAMVEAFDQNKICSVLVEFYDLKMLPGFQEALGEELFNGAGDFMPRMTEEERQRIEEELRRQRGDDEPYPF